MSPNIFQYPHQISSDESPTRGVTMLAPRSCDCRDDVIQCYSTAQGRCEVPAGRPQHNHGHVGELPLPGLRHELGGAREGSRRQIIPGGPISGNSDAVKVPSHSPRLVIAPSGPHKASELMSQGINKSLTLHSTN